MCWSCLIPRWRHRILRVRRHSRKHSANVPPKRPVSARGERRFHPFTQDTLMLSLVLNIVLPTVIMMRFASEDKLGPVNALLVALAFPLIYGVYGMVKER